MTLRGDLHLIEKLDHVSRLQDGRWISGYWDLSEHERRAVRRLYLHATKSSPAHWGGRVIEVLPATEFEALARKHDTDPDDRWVLVVVPDVAAKGMHWQGATYSMAYKSLV